LAFEAFAALMTDGYEVAVPPLRRVLRAYLRDVGADGIGWLWYGALVPPEVWDDGAWDLLTTHMVRLAREAGGLSNRALVLDGRGRFHVHAGELDLAAAFIEEGDLVSDATRTPHVQSAAHELAAWRGHDDMTVRSIDESIGFWTSVGNGRIVGIGGYAKAVYYNARGDYDAALSAAQQACEYDDIGTIGWSLAELVEAAERAGERAVAVDALERLATRTRASGTDWALGVLARSSALLDDGDTAASRYAEAIERLERTRMAPDLARARLVYGEWLRRANRRVDAREQLRSACDSFSDMRMDAFAERARRELAATGERARRRTVETTVSLTPQESQIARLAAARHTNPEIAARLFISPRTVEYHLAKVFSKLAISSRRELPGALEKLGLTASTA
jgi:DNA-binding CsgD family transcriptional regulator